MAGKCPQLWISGLPTVLAQPTPTSSFAFLSSLRTTVNGLSAAVDEVAFDARGRRTGADPNFVIQHEQCSDFRALANGIQVGTTGRALVRNLACQGGP